MKWVIWFSLGVTAAVASGTQQQAMDLNERGLAASNRGDQPESIRLFQQAIDIWRELGPPYEAHLATTEANLADSFCLEGNRREGARLLEDALARFRRTLGNRHPSTVTAMNTLAGVRLMLAETDAASQLLEEALPIGREIFPNDLQLARTLVGLSVVHLRRQQYLEALSPAEEALRITAAAKGEESPDTALAYLTVAEVHRCMRNYARAMPLFHKAQAIYEHVLGPDHLRVATVQTQEGLVLMEQGKLAMAEKSMTTALRILDRSCASCVSERFVAETNLALLRIQHRKYAEADRLLSGALDLQERANMPPSIEVASALNTLASVREKERLFDDAARLHKRADAIRSFLE